MTAVKKTKTHAHFRLTPSPNPAWDDAFQAQIRLTPSPKLALHEAFSGHFQSPYSAHPYLPWGWGQIRPSRQECTCP